jgi:uncharacterized protein YecE (DUF72 family)
MESKPNIKIGPAGWSYKDWLEYLARFFDTVEINSSFYRPPTAATAKSWAKRASQNPRFSFTAKLHRLFTHERGKATAADEKAFREGIDPLFKAGKLGALLLQFPWSFKNTAEDRRYLTTLLDRLKDYRLVLEVRHASWNDAQIYEWLEERGVGICNIDQPLFSKSIRPAALITSPVGYVRLHGRNYENWFKEKAVRDERYNYLYSIDELEPWIARIREVASESTETYVITNNHFRGQAVVNALEIKSTLVEQRVPAPEPLFSRYPRLLESAIPESETNVTEEQTPRLFR